MLFCLVLSLFWDFIYTELKVPDIVIQLLDAVFIFPPPVFSVSVCVILITYLEVYRFSAQLYQVN